MNRAFFLIRNEGFGEFYLIFGVMRYNVGTVQGTGQEKGFVPSRAEKPRGNWGRAVLEVKLYRNVPECTGNK